MIEQAMVFALGFMIAGLIALAIAPAFWRRAIRLSTRRLEMQLPLSATEIRADRDLLRAEFAVEARRLEQKAAALNLAHAADLAQLGRSASLLVERDAEAASLNARLADMGAEIAELRGRLAHAVGEFAAAATALDSETILVERKDAELLALGADLAAERAAAQEQGETLERVKTLLAREEGHVAAQTELIDRLELEISALRTERSALEDALKLAETKSADFASALSLAAKRESRLQTKRARQIETMRAFERRFVERQDRLRASEADAKTELAGSRAAAEGLRLELAELRRTMAELNLPAGGRANAAEAEENAALRQTVNEIGAAIIRMAASGLTPPTPLPASAPTSSPAAPQPAAAPMKAEREEPAKAAGRSVKAEAPSPRAGAL